MAHLSSQDSLLCALPRPHKKSTQAPGGSLRRLPHSAHLCSQTDRAPCADCCLSLRVCFPVTASPSALFSPWHTAGTQETAGECVWQRWKTGSEREGRIGIWAGSVVPRPRRPWLFRDLLGSPRRDPRTGRVETAWRPGRLRKRALRPREWRAGRGRAGEGRGSSLRRGRTGWRPRPEGGCGNPRRPSAAGEGSTTKAGCPEGTLTVP